GAGQAGDQYGIGVGEQEAVDTPEDGRRAEQVVRVGQVDHWNAQVSQRRGEVELAVDKHQVRPLLLDEFPSVQALRGHGVDEQTVRAAQIDHILTADRQVPRTGLVRGKPAGYRAGFGKRLDEGKGRRNAAQSWGAPADRNDFHARTAAAVASSRTVATNDAACTRAPTPDFSFSMLTTR